MIRSAGAKLFFLPRYSPDLNQIEQVFAKLKTLLRQTDPRTCGRSQSNQSHDPAGPANCFRAYVEQFLVPTLSAGDIVIMDAGWGWGPARSAIRASSHSLLTGV